MEPPGTMAVHGGRNFTGNESDRLEKLSRLLLLFFFFFCLLRDNYADYMSINVPFINFRAHTSPAAFLSALPIMFASVSQEYY